jgi:hypothetical protein
VTLRHIASLSLAYIKLASARARRLGAVLLHLRRHQRLGLVLWLVLALLYTQLATAAYACPRGLPAVSPATSAEVEAVTGATGADDLSAMAGMADMADCDGMMMTSATGPAAMDPAQPQLCKLHCGQGSQTVQPGAMPDAPSTPQLLAVLDWAPCARLPAGDALRVRRLVPSGAAPPGAPPLYLALLALRH